MVKWGWAREYQESAVAELEDQMFEEMPLIEQKARELMLGEGQRRWQREDGLPRVPDSVCEPLRAWNHAEVVGAQRPLLGRARARLVVSGACETGFP